MNHRQKIGQWGEQAALEYLTTRGYQLLDRNARTPYGEIDLVTRLGDVIIFGEVKTRTTRSFGLPEEAVTARKLAHMSASAAFYASERGIEHWQLDAIAVEGFPGQTPHIEHFENITP